MISWQRITYYLGLALVEATPPALLLTLAGGSAWGLLIGVALLGALADWIVLRRLPPNRQQIALAAIGLLCAFWMVKVQVLGDYGLLGDWGQALGAIFSLSHPRAGIAYLSLLATLYSFWRGTQLTLHDSLSLHRRFRIAAFSLLLIAMLGIFTTGRAITLVLDASIEVLAFFAVGLVTMALASSIEHQDTGLRRLGARGMLILCGAVALVVVLGLLAGTFFSDSIGVLVRGLWSAVVLVIALILAPFLYLFAILLEWLFKLAGLRAMFERLGQILPPGQLQPQPAGEFLAIFPAWVQAVLRIFFTLLPILLILALLMLARRRRKRSQDAEEERESLWSWSGLADDLRSLLAGLHGPRRAEGLRDALARLRGGDPASRVRRSYIRLLLLGEAREQPRHAAQTPREYQPAASALLPAVAQPIETLTGAYERARYHPSATTSADADAAERAWSAIEQSEDRVS